MHGKTCIVTGANQGIGKATAIGLARVGARVVMVCRNRERGEAARSEVMQASGSEQVTLHIADFARQRQVRSVADELIAAYDRIDVLLNNAAVVSREREVSEEGFEMQWAVNHLAPFLLTDLLLPTLLDNPGARIVTVASDAHRSGQIGFGDLQSERHYSLWKAYAQAKVANVLFTYALARRLEGRALTANCLHPGVIATTLLKQFTPHAAPWLRWVIDLVMASPARGARTSIYLATSPEVAGVSGQYFKRRRPARSASLTYDRALQERLWALSMEQTGAGQNAERLEAHRA